MDQAPRQAFLAAAVLPGERTALSGTVSIVKNARAGGRHRVLGLPRCPEAVGSGVGRCGGDEGGL